MKPKQVLFFITAGFILSSCFISCKYFSSPKLDSFDSLTQTLIKKHSDYDPEFFLKKTNTHSLIRVNYRNGIYKLEETKVYIVPGKYDSIIAPGTLLIKFMDALNDSIGFLSTSPPYHFIIEHPGDSVHSLDVPSIVFDLPFPSNPAIKKIVFLENSIVKSFIAIPTDTVDVIGNNKSAPLDPNLF